MHMSTVPSLLIALEIDGYHSQFNEHRNTGIAELRQQAGMQTTYACAKLHYIDMH